MNGNGKASRYIPSGSTPIEREDLDAVVYLHEVNGKPLAIGYSGKRGKSDFHFRFLSAEKRTVHIEQYFAGLARKQQDKKERAEAKRNFLHSFQVGDILHYSWGYDQTNPEFYQVVAVGQKTITLREIAQTSASGSEGFMSDRRLPVLDKFIGPEIIKRA